MGIDWRNAIWPDDRVRRFLHLLLLLYFLKQIFIAFTMPAFTGHDEVAHFQYIRTVATEYRLPIIPDLEFWRENREQDGPKTGGDFFDIDLYPYANYVLDWFTYQPDEALYERYVNEPIHAVTFPDFVNDIRSQSWPSGWQYAANHPPLYYVIAAPLYRATDWMSLENQMLVLRLIAIPFGALAVAGTWLMARYLFPASGFLAVTASTIVAFQPQVSYEAAMINNDILVIGLGTLLLALLLRGMRFGFPRRLVVAIGLLFGLMLLSKGSAIVFALPIALMMIAGIGPRRIRMWAPKGLAVAGIGFLAAAPWYLFLYRTYGNFSGLDQIADLQMMHTYQQGTDPPDIWNDLIWNERFAVMRWNETWGEFGWRLMPLKSNLLWVIGVPFVVCLIGFLAWSVRLMVRRRPAGVRGTIANPETWQRWAVGGLFLTCLLGYAAVIQFGMRFQLTQARYFFPMLPAAIVLVMIGLHTLVPRRARSYAQVAVVAGMLALNIYIFAAYVLPYWYARADSPIL
ncbi:MAG: glycosyltransferase family 39 protein [Thermomicrobiales bacterium]|nr:glycosyltransferase family 39 protein [Thermomicrobiales bacterium]